MVKANTLEAYQLFHDGAQALARAEMQGVRIDTEYFKEQEERLTKRIKKLEKRLHKSEFVKNWKSSIKKVKFNIYSSQQLSYYLYKKKKLKPPKRTKMGGQGATDDDSLTYLGIKELQWLLTARKLKKIRDTYIKQLAREQVNNIIHPVFNLHLVRTFRSSSDHPNLQNIPKRDDFAMQIVRGGLLPREGYLLVEFDYSGIEVRVSICYHKDPKMRQYVEDPTTDMHRDMAQEIYLLNNFDESIHEHDRLRDATKNGFVFPQFYGDYYEGCAFNLACKWGKLPQSKWKSGQGIVMPSVGEDAHLSDWLIQNGIGSYKQFVTHIKRIEKRFWNSRFRVYNQWKDEWWEEYIKKGYIELLSGFTVSDLMDKRQCGNTPIQGSAFHCLMWSFNRIDEVMRREKWKSRLIGQIHDSILMDIHPSELDHVVRVVREISCGDLPKAWRWIIVPLEMKIERCEVDKPWSEKEALVA